MMPKRAGARRSGTMASTPSSPAPGAPPCTGSTLTTSGGSRRSSVRCSSLFRFPSLPAGSASACARARGVSSSFRRNATHRRSCAISRPTCAPDSTRWRRCRYSSSTTVSSALPSTRSSMRCIAPAWAPAPPARGNRRGAPGSARARARGRTTALPPWQRRVLLSDPVMVDRLHAAVWALPDRERAARWGRPAGVR